MLKKKVSLFLAVLLMLCTVISAHADLAYTGSGPITDEANAEISVLAQTHNMANVDILQAPIVQKVVEKSGISIDWQLIDYNSYSESVAPMLASGNVDADIIKIPDNDLNQKYIKSGLFEPLSDHFDWMPNYVAWLEKYPEAKAAMTADDGKIYYVPKTDEGLNFRPGLMYNQVWLDKAGIQAPTTLDAFVDMLRYFRDNDMNGNGDPSDEIPMSVMGDFLPYMFGPAFGLDLVSEFQADENGVVTYGYADEKNYKDYLVFLNGLYEEGLLEAEYSSLTREQVIERFSNDLTGVSFDFSWAMSMMYSAVLPYYDGTADTAVIGVAPLSGTHEGFYVGGRGYSNMFGVNSHSDKLELAIKFLDFSFSEENQEMYQWGIEGESYVLVDGKKVYTEQASDNDWLQRLGINPAFLFPANTSKESTYELLPDWHCEIDTWQEQFIHDPWPFIYSTEEESEVLNKYTVDIETYTKENQAAFIMGTKSLDRFDEYINGFNSLHLPEILAIKQAQYTRFFEAMK